MTASVEVVDAVQQLLESEGVLQSIRAQLRASVVNALASKTSERRPSKAVSFMSKSSGRDSILCVMDLLSKLNLRETLSVLEAEIGMSNADFNTQSSRDDLIEKLLIMSSVNDVYEPILYQLLQTTANAAAEKEKSPRLMIDPTLQRESKSTLATTQWRPHTDNTFTSSSSSNDLQKDTDTVKNGRESEEKRAEESLPDLKKKNLISELPVSAPKSNAKDDSPDDSFAEEKSVYEPSTVKDYKQQEVEKKGDTNGVKAAFATNKGSAKDDEDDDEDEDMPFESTPQDDEIEDDDIEIEVGSESSTSFSLEYGYVDDDKPVTAIAGAKETVLDTKVSSADKDKEQPVSVFKLPSSTVIAPSEIPTLVKSADKSQNEISSSVDPSERVGVQKLAAGSITRSKFGWDVDRRDDEGEDFMFSEEPESTLHSNKSSQGRNSTGPGMSSSLYRASTMREDENGMEETVLEEMKTTRPVLPPTAKSSWGSKPDPKNDDDDGDNNDTNSDVESIEDDDESVQSNSDEEHEQIQSNRRKSNNQEEESDEEVTNRGNNDKPKGSLFMSRSQSGALPSLTTTTAPQVKKFQATTSNSRSDDDDDDVSGEFEMDTNYSKDENTFMSSNSSKLSEVEKKLAEMERDNVDLMHLRIQDEKLGKLEKLEKNNDSGVSNGGDGDYSEGDFESGSEGDNDGEKSENEDENEDDNEKSEDDNDDKSEKSDEKSDKSDDKGDKSEDEYLDLGDDESVASENIDNMELSVGGAGSDSDGSFSGLNSLSSNKKVTAKKESGLWNNNPTIINKNTANTISYKPVITRKRSADESDVSQSVSDSVEFSVNDVDMSSSRGVDTDSGYDFTANVVPVQSGTGTGSSSWTGGRGPRDRSGL